MSSTVIIRPVQPQSPSLEETLSFLKQLSTHIHDNEALQQTGLPPHFTADLLAVIKNPTKGVIRFKNQLDAEIRNVATKLVKSFFASNTGLAEKVVLTEDSSQTGLHFSIVLLEDSEEKRGKALNFYKIYNTTELAEEYPVYFQFTTENQAEGVIILPA